ncbi:hypothetical protein ABT324_06510 [Saccharopolyspora sp. NPDC000359]|uniref:ATP-binding protein n=1 Tax=Saccharopolyspora sp. NPDC000359 TaxID=3154251 RepID=UPI003327EBF5
MGRFALGLQRLRQEAGKPSYETLSYETTRLGHGFSDTSLRNAAAGKQVPTWDVTEMFVRACVAFAHTNPERAVDAVREWTPKGLVAEWARRWRELRHAPEPVEPRDETSGCVGNLPAELTTFVGRAPELAAAEQLLTRSRLVTVVGGGGVGKTRLALQIADRAARAFPDGVWLVELARSASAAHAVADALGAPEADLPVFLAGKRLVLVLDTCEHLAEECAALARRLLAVAPNALVVATSRQPLGVTGEHVLVARPLADDDAVALFADRAAAVAPEYAVGAEDREVIAELCRRVDNLPLAVEMAARWVRVLKPQELLARLGDGFGLLRNGDRGSDDRHRTLRAVFDWSWNLCSPVEQVVWARLSLFETDIALESAERVGAEGGLTAEDVLAALAGLVDKSVLTTVDSGGLTRYALPGLVRQYGRNRLAEVGRARRLARTATGLGHILQRSPHPAPS